ncbi:YmaF family protein [Clostridium gasigenes]|uniref:YmaF family protein n=1 Tax=Clostridium gasigenes TaxID=94869 RepID=A0A1H0LFV6_9CLOT|nr:YmaF family protein [Clostridium gasigenes]SDO67098.1 YmaF family protein [Clostridium gasigenes]
MYTNNCSDPCKKQTHVHEFLGSTKFAEEGDDRHNHRFAGISGEAIPEHGSHVHKIKTRTDFLDHFHEICVTTGPAIPVGNGKHVHLVTGVTTVVENHQHQFIFATLIEAPAVS